MGVKTYTKETTSKNDTDTNSTQFFIVSEDIDVSVYNDNSIGVRIEKGTIIYIDAINSYYADKKRQEQIGYRISFYYAENKELNSKEIYVSNERFAEIKSLLIQNDIIYALQKRYDKAYEENLDKEDKAYKSFTKKMIWLGLIQGILAIITGITLATILHKVEIVAVIIFIAFVVYIIVVCGFRGIMPYSDKCTWYSSFEPNEEGYRMGRANRNALREVLVDNFNDTTYHSSDSFSTLETIKGKWQSYDNSPLQLFVTDDKGHA